MGILNAHGSSSDTPVPGGGATIHPATTTFGAHGGQLHHGTAAPHPYPQVFLDREKHIGQILTKGSANILQALGKVVELSKMQYQATVYSGDLVRLWDLVSTMCLGLMDDGINGPAGVAGRRIWSVRPCRSGSHGRRDQRAKGGRR